MELLTKLKWKKKTTRQLSISFDDQCIQFVEATIDDKGIKEVHNVFKEENSVIKDGGALDKFKWNHLVKKVLKEKKIKAKIVHVILPTSLVIVRHQVMPQLSEQELKQMIHYEVGSTIHLPFEAPVIDVVKVDTGEAVYKDDGEIGTQVALVAAPGNLVYPLVEVLLENRLKPKSVDIPALSLYRLFKQNYPELKNDAVLISHVTRDGVDLHIFENGIVWFTRHIPLALQDADRENVDIVDNLPDAKTLLERIQSKEVYQSFIIDFASEMERAVNFYQYTLNNRDSTIASCWISSDIPFPDTFYLFLQQRMDIEVKQLTYEIDKEKIAESQLTGFEIAVGTLFREVNNDGN